MTLQERLEFVDKWLAELRSGERKQAIGGLHLLNDAGETDGQCCLGVACELAFDAGLLSRRVSSGNTYAYYPLRDIADYNSGKLPHFLAQELGLHTPYAHFNHTSLTSMNDNGIPFPVIADTIESEMAWLFSPEFAEAWQKYKQNKEAA